MLKVDDERCRAEARELLLVALMLVARVDGLGRVHGDLRECVFRARKIIRRVMKGDHKRFTA
jgi:hypothetical protein